MGKQQYMDQKSDEYTCLSFNIYDNCKSCVTIILDLFDNDCRRIWLKFKRNSYSVTFQSTHI